MRPILLLCAAIALAAGEAAPILPKPSGNAGKPGTYQVESGVPGCSYYVCVPAQPAKDAHWGLHLFFHGQNGQGGAQHFGSWQAPLLDAYGLIGINMCYADGDNLKNPAGKVAAARAAVLQVMADYPVVPGRGMVACFSGGGIPSGQWYAASGRNLGLAFPFIAHALYSSNYTVGVNPTPGTGWYVGVNQDEWGLANLGSTQTARFGEVMASIAKSGPDHRFLCLPKVGHTVDARSIAAAAQLFRRIDLAYAPFIHAATLPAKPLAAIIAAANAGEIGQAAAALAKLKPGAVPAEQADALKALLDARAAAQAAMVAELAADDPLLAVFYGNRFSKSLKGHPAQADVAAALAKVERKAVQPAAAALDAFAKQWPQLFAKDATIAVPAVANLEQIVKAAGERSNIGTMASELLALPHAAGK